MIMLSEAEKLALESLTDGEWHLATSAASSSQPMWLACTGLVEAFLYLDRVEFQITERGRDAIKTGGFHADPRGCLAKIDNFLNQGYDPAWLVGCLVQICLWQDEQIQSLRESSRVDLD